MKKVKVGLVGLGNIGTKHADYLSKMESVDFAAVCDIIKDKADLFREKYGANAYYDYREMLEKEKLDAVIIAVPHYDHTPISVDAFEKGINVLCEKPLAVHVNDAEKSVSAFKAAKSKNDKLVFAMMFQERTYAHYRKIKEILESGRLGKLIRVTWIDTTRFRTQKYYNSGGWRATWAGEGGGILSKQCPHNLDMYQWLFGLPKSVNGFAGIGKYHDIEVEDEVTAYFEHENGMVGHFIVSTAEAPGSNRLEISAENGKLIYEDGELIFYQNVKSMLDVLETSDVVFDSVEYRKVIIPVDNDLPRGHSVVAGKFINSILNEKEDLFAHGAEGVNSVMLANAIMLSSFKNERVTLPIDADEYEGKLNELVKNSKFKKVVDESTDVDMDSSFAK
jgi:predicted dehydrogenase